MANQPTPIRPWFRLGSIRAPPPAPTPAAAQPRPVVQSRPTFRGIAPPIQPQPTQPSESPKSQAPPSPRSTPPAALAIAPTAADPTAAAPPASAAAPTAGTISNAGSVPSSPVAGKVSAPSASLPTSPIQQAASPTHAVFPAPTLSSLPSSPQVKASAPSSSPVPTSPISRPVTTSVNSAPLPPVAKVSGLLPASPPAAVLPAPTASSVPSSPQAKVSAPLSLVQTSIPGAFPPSNSVHTSPVQRTAEAIQNSEDSASPKAMRPAVKTPPQSPKMKVAALPPSPLTLPPSELKPREKTVPKIPVEAEQKTVLVQKTIEKPKSLYNGYGGDFMRSSSQVRKSAMLHNSKKVSDSEDGIARIITLAGENKGAVMELIQSPKKHGFGSSPKNFHDNGNSTIKTNGGRWEHHGSSSSNEDDNVERKHKIHGSKTKASPPLTAYMNSNVQGINNSIMYGAECKHNDPGVHLNLSRKPFSKHLEHKEHVIPHN